MELLKSAGCLLENVLHNPNQKIQGFKGIYNNTNECMRKQTL